MPSYEPFFQSERCFRRYEEVIAQAIHSFPKTVRFTSPRRPTTDVARLRDALRTYKKKRWPASFKYEDYIRIEAFLKVWIDRNEICIGRDEPVAGEDRHNDATIASSEIFIELSHPDEAEAVIELVERGVFSDPLTVLSPTDEIAKALHDATIGKINVALNVDTNRITIF